ncbi:hypothetical protein Tsubulata_027021 [Turnera subulata]|uniref:Ribosome-inactivating protein n=1 Tax=Turnera subulata TaxID=218843 RepID=A0A9Q0JPY4_9ROSI|nr:hypothetical protein Tsubulata_027021 [Turnera subulata]
MQTKCGVVVIVALACWILVVGADAAKDLGRFNVDDETDVESYQDFILRVRSLVSVGEFLGIDRLSEDTLTGNSRWGLLRLENYGNAITLVIDLNNLYVVGFHSENPGVENVLYYFTEVTFDGNEAPRFDDHFPGAVTRSLEYSGSYTGGLRDRESVGLGRYPLMNAITTLYYRSGSPDNWMSSLIVVVQMISEAVRSNFVLHELGVGFDQNLPPDDLVMNAENSWGVLSRAVWNALPNGDLRQEDKNSIASKLKIKDEINTFMDILMLGFLSVLARPKKEQNPTFPHHHHHSLNIRRSIIDDMPVIQQQEVKEIRIAGPKGLSVDVPNEEYHSGKEVFLWPCKYDNNPNQLWTFTKDGTIRSKNFCLKAYGGCPSPNYIMLYECPVNPIETFAHWELRQDGTIVHYLTGLVLTARSAKKGSLGTLTVDVDKKVPGQGWAASRDISTLGPALARIEWLPAGGCLNMRSSSDERRVELGDCNVGSGLTNQWNIYWHRYIQNSKNEWACLGCKDPYLALCEDGSDIVVQSCCAGNPGQRWEITGDGGIKNPATGLFLTVVKKDSGRRLIAAPQVHGGSVSQSWISHLNA